MNVNALQVGARVLVLVPDLSLGGGVPNYYRVLKLNHLDEIDYFVVNHAETRNDFSKVLCLAPILFRYLMHLPRYDIVHLNTSLNYRSFWRDALFQAFACLLRRRTIVFFRGWDEAYEDLIRTSRWRTKMFRATFGRADRFLVLGQIFAEKVRDLLDRADVPIEIETTVADDTGLCHANKSFTLRDEHGPVNLLFLSRLVEGKGILTAVRTVSALREMNPTRHWRLRVAGKGPLLLPAKDLVRELKLENAISFEGHVNSAERAHLLRESHLLVCPTTYSEGLPNCILEAMLFGLPIVACPAGAIGELLVDGENGALIDHPSADRFATAVSTLVASPEQCARISARNRMIAEDRFTPNRVRRRLLSLYQDLAGAQAE